MLAGCFWQRAMKAKWACMWCFPSMLLLSVDAYWGEDAPPVQEMVL